MCDAHSKLIMKVAKLRLPNHLKTSKFVIGPVLRNLLRNPRRTGLAISAIGFGVISILLAGGFIEWIFWAMRESAIQSRLGHVQVVRPGYFDAGSADPFSYLLPPKSQALATIERMPQVRVVAPRLNFTGLISHGETTVAFIGQGVAPDQEKLLSREVHIAEGDSLSSLEPGGVMLGAGLAANVGVKPGDQLVLLATTAGGGLNAVEARVRGLFYTSTKAFDDSALRVNIDLARQLVRVSGTHAWAILLDDTRHTDAVIERLRLAFSSDRDKYQFVPWHELSDFYNKTVKLFSRQVKLVWLIIGLIIVLGITNTLVMSVLERTREIGTLMAIGIKRRSILGLFVAEGTLLGIIAGAIGSAIGVPLAIGISAVGIPMPPPPGMAVGFTGEILITWPLALSALTLAVGAAALASVYPAWKASRLEIVDALRHER